MVEKTEYKTTQPELPNNQVELPEDMQVKGGTDKVRTPGWRVFDFLAHFVVNTVINIGLSVVMVVDRANYKAKKGDFGDVSNHKANDTKTFLTDIPLPGGKKFNFYEFSDWLDTLFYNKDDKGKIAEKPKGQGFTTKVNSLQKAGGVFGWLEEKGGKNIFGVRQILKPLGTYTPSILFLAWGGHLTNSIMWALESPKIKPTLVKFFDKVNDSVRGVFGIKASAEELQERKEIYAKLDGELSGKSIKGVWGARLAGIATIIGVASVGEAIDNSIMDHKGKKRSDSPGLLRVSEGFFAAAKYHKGGMKAHGKEFDPAFLSEDSQSIDAKRAKYITGNTVIEIAGTGITAGVQYVYLMMQEFFGVGPKTGMKDKDAQSVEKSNAVTTPPNASKQVELSTPAKTVEEKPAPKVAQSTQNKIDDKVTEIKENSSYGEKVKAKAEIQSKGESHQDVAKNTASGNLAEVSY